MIPPDIDDPDALAALGPWMQRQRTSGAPPGFPDRVMTALASRRRRPRIPAWLGAAAVLLAVPVLLGRLVALVLVFLP